MSDEDYDNLQYNMMPLWSLNSLKSVKDRIYYEFEIRGERIFKNDRDFDFNPHFDHQTPTINYKEYKCHICNIGVPDIYLTEHNNSNKHIDNLTLTKNALARINKHISEPMPKDSIVELQEYYFCEHCAKIVPSSDKSNHEITKKHVALVNYDEYLNNFVKIFTEENEPELLLMRIQRKDSVKTDEKTKLAQKNCKLEPKQTFNQDTKVETTDDTIKAVINKPCKTSKVQSKETPKHTKTNENKKTDKEYKIVTTKNKTHSLVTYSCEGEDTNFEKQAEQTKIYYPMERTDNPKELLCKICNVRVPNNAKNLDQHLDSIKHLSNYTSNEAPNNTEAEYYCDVCRVYVAVTDATSHSKSNNHIKLMKEKKAKKVIIKENVHKYDTTQIVKCNSSASIQIGIAEQKKHVDKDTSITKTEFKDKIVVMDSIDITKIEATVLPKPNNDNKVPTDKEKEVVTVLDEDTTIQNDNMASTADETEEELSNVSDSESSSHNDDIGIEKYINHTTKSYEKTTSFERYIDYITSTNPIITHHISVIHSNEIKIETFRDCKEVKVNVDNFHGYSGQRAVYNVICTLCDEVLSTKENIEYHEYSRMHVQKIMAEIEDMNCIRELPYNFSHCIICNNIIHNKDIDIHKNSQEHIKILNEALITKIDIDSVNDQQKIDEVTIPADVDGIRKLCPDKTDVNEENETMIQINPSTSANSHMNEETQASGTDKSDQIKMNSAAIEKPGTPSTVDHIEDDNDTKAVPATKKLKGSSTYCNVCKIDILDNDLVAHFKGKKHNKAVKKATEACNNEESTNQDDKLNYQMEKSNTNTVKCKVCDITIEYTTQAINKHLETFEHRYKYVHILASNGIQELKNNFYCEACGLDIPKSNELNHINETEHKANEIPTKEITMYVSENGTLELHCKVCKVKIPSSLDTMNHESSAEHVRNYRSLMESNKIQMPGLGGLYCFCNICQTHVLKDHRFNHINCVKHRTLLSRGTMQINMRSGLNLTGLPPALIKHSFWFERIYVHMNFKEYIEFIRPMTDCNHLTVIDSNNIEIKAEDGHIIEVSFNNFHGYVKVTDNVVQCRICNEWISGQMLEHKFTMEHTRRVTIRVKDKHGIRLLDGYWSHCVLCNVTISNQSLRHHITQDKAHERHLQEALIPTSMGYP